MFVYNNFGNVIYLFNTTVNNSLALFERASGCRVHRDPLNKECKFLPLGRWCTSLKQEDIPCDYMTLSVHLDMVGVTLMASWVNSRKEKKVKNTVNPNFFGLES